MIKLDTNIMEDIDLQELKGYWSDFDESKPAFTMEVNDNDIYGQLIDLNEQLQELEDIIKLMEV